MAVLGNARLLIGAYGDDTAGANAGAVYLFAYNFPPAITEYPVTQSSSWETEPRLGNDGISDLVVFMQRDTNTDGSMGPGTVWFQRLDTTGLAMGQPVQVSNSTNHNHLDDVSGDWIAYTAYDSVSTMSGRVMAYQISTGVLHVIASVSYMQEVRLCGRNVVWREGGTGAAQVMLYDLNWLGTSRDANIIAGPIPPTYQLDIGDPFVVWAEKTSLQQDIVAYDVTAGVRVGLTATPEVNDAEPSTSGAWIVWQAQDKGAANSRILARNLDTAEERVIVDNGQFNYRPSVDGDLIAYEGMASGNLGVFVYRISTGETFQITTNSADHYLNDVFGNNVAYVDQRTGTEDIYVSHLQFVPSLSLSTNAALAGLVLSAGTMTPAFDAAVTNYTASVPHRTNSITVTPTSADTTATIQVRVNGAGWSNVLSGTTSPALALNVGTNLIDVKVTAQDLSTIKTYTLTITVLPPAVLRVALTSTNTVLLAWPAALTGYDLEQNANLNTTNWLPVTNPPVVVGDEKQVTVPPAPDPNFYRLHKP